MSIVVKGGKSFTPPPEGVWGAVCVDVVDLGVVKSELYGDKEKVRITWELSELMADGKPYIASKMFSKTLHERSSLYKFLTSWRGKTFSAEELTGFDLEKLLGAPCQLVVTHDERDGIVYGNITTVLKAARGQALKPSGSFIRHKDRLENQKNAPAGNPDYADSEPEDMVPF